MNPNIPMETMSAKHVIKKGRNNPLLAEKTLEFVSVVWLCKWNENPMVMVKIRRLVSNLLIEFIL